MSSSGMLQAVSVLIAIDRQDPLDVRLVKMTLLDKRLRESTDLISIGGDQGLGPSPQAIEIGVDQLIELRRFSENPCRVSFVTGTP